MLTVIESELTYSRTFSRRAASALIQKEDASEHLGLSAQRVHQGSQTYALDAKILQEPHE